jgi:hypothetical protein
MLKVELVPLEPTTALVALFPPAPTVTRYVELGSMVIPEPDNKPPAPAPAPMS